MCQRAITRIAHQVGAQRRFRRAERTRRGRKRAILVIALFPYNGGPRRVAVL
jgi:hypothetical protein